MRLYTWLVIAGVASGCATLPADRTQRALYVDTQKALLGEKRLGWTVDRVEIEEAANQAELSACYVPKEQRLALRRWVSDRIAENGGPAKAQFEHGTDEDDLDDVIELERAAAVLDQIELHMPADCPFWVRPNPKFRGIHSTASRFVLIAESMGSGALLYSQHTWSAGGGGQARLFMSYGFPKRLQFAVGAEGGGDAVLQKGTNGDLSPAGVFRFGVPAFFRWNDLDRIYDLEFAAIARFDNGRLEPWGGRVALAGGVNGLRRLGVMPAIQLWIGYELYPEQHHIAAQSAFRLGTRVALDYDP